MVMTGQGATFSRDLFLPYERHGYVEETYWTFSCSPVQDGNRISGLLVAAMDTTRQVLAERQARPAARAGRVLQRGDGQRPAGGPDGRRRDRAEPDRLPFSLAHLLDDSRRFLHLVGSFGVDPGTVRDWSVIPGPDDGIPGWRVVTSGKAEVVGGINASFRAVVEPSVLGDAQPDDAMILPLRNRPSGDAPAWSRSA